MIFFILDLNISETVSFQSIPQRNQLFSPSNLLTDYLKQTGIMEPLITDCLNKKDGY